MSCWPVALLITLWVQMHVESIYVRGACLFTGICGRLSDCLLQARTAIFPKRFIMHVISFFFTGKVLPGVAALSDAKKD